MVARLAAVAVASLLAGCDDLRDQLPTSLPPAEPTTTGSRFDPTAAGEVVGTARWVGGRPAVPPVRFYRPTPAGPRWADLPNPNLPRIAPGGGLAGAVVFLRGIETAAAAPWPHPAVAVEADDEDVTVVPGGRVGFVPVGAEVEFRSASDSFLGVRARGAAFFTLLLPERRAARRRLDRPGRVELTSPAAVHWAVADLFVCEHPYYTRTDDRGRFRFAAVPPGKYEVVCWVPNWRVAGTDRDPESGAVFRTRYAPPAEVAGRVRVVPGSAPDVRIDVSASSFPPPR